MTRSLFESLPRAEVRIGKQVVPTYLLCGGSGVLVASFVLVLLAVLKHEHPLMAFGMLGLLVGSFIVLSLLRRVFSRSETHVLLEHWLFAMAVAWGALTLAQVKVYLWLDLLTVAYCIVFAFGRIGCTLSGCCHGVPASFGLRYGKVTLFPVQPLECVVWVFLAMIATACTFYAAPATALGVVCAVYGLIRLILERFRDDERIKLGAWTESEVLSVVLLLIGVAVLWHLRPLQPKQAVLCAFGIAMGLMAFVTRRFWISLEAAEDSTGNKNNTSSTLSTIVDAIRKGAINSTPRLFECEGFSIAVSEITAPNNVPTLVASVPKHAVSLDEAKGIFGALAELCSVRTQRPPEICVQDSTLVCLIPYVQGELASPPL